MTIGIEAQRLFRNKKHGMEIVALELIRALQTIDRNTNYVIFVKEDEDTGCLSETNNFKIKRIKKSPYPVWEQYLLPKAVKEEEVDLLHCTSNTAPLFLNVPMVLTLHDIIYLESLNFKGSTYQNFGNLYRRLIVPAALRKSEIIITVSDFERERIIAHTKIDRQRIKCIYNAKNKSFEKIVDQSQLENVRQIYSLPVEFILFFGNTAPKKNTKRVIKAYADYVQSSGDILPLVVTDCQEKYIRSLLIDIEQPSLIDHIVVKDYIDFKDLPSVYNLASLFLYPSLRESFGLPIIESMACGTPVITSNTSSMPEVAGGAALLVDPQNSDAIAAAIKKILSDTQVRNQLITTGLQRAMRFNWNVAARQILEVYQNLLNKQPSHVH